MLGLFGPDDQLADATRTLVVNLDYSNALNTRVIGPGGGVLIGLTSVIPETSVFVLIVTGPIGLLCYV